MWAHHLILVLEMPHKKSCPFRTASFFYYIEHLVMYQNSIDNHQIKRLDKFLYKKINSHSIQLKSAIIKD